MRVEFGEFVLDTAARHLLRGGEPLHVRPKVFELLELLVEKRPCAVSKTRIRERLWPGTHVAESNLPVLARQLRRVLGDDPGEPRWIRTLVGFGYAFCGDAHPPGDDPTRPWDCRVILGEREIVLRPCDNLIGRARDATVWVDGDSVSRQHAVIHVAEDGVFLEDCGSRNGTFRRGERIDGVVRLEDQDEIAVGGVLLTVLVTHRDDHAGGSRSSRSTAPQRKPPR